MASESNSKQPVIVVGVDGSDSSVNALKWAHRQAQLTDSMLEVVMTWDFPAAYGSYASFPTGFDPQAETQASLQKILDDVLGKEPDLKVRAVVSKGNPSPVLKERSTGASLLVLGSRGHGGFSGLLLGSVSEYLIAHASCPVVVIRNTEGA